MTTSHHLPPVSPTAIRALLEVSGATLPRARLDAGGTRLRLRALYVMGHGSGRIADALGVHEMIIRRIVRGEAPTVRSRVRDDVRDLYDAWWDKRAPERTRAERRAASSARQRAIAGNWCVGAGLDDDDLDTPGYRPTSKWKPATGTGVAPGIYLSARCRENQPLHQARDYVGPVRRLLDAQRLVRLRRIDAHRHPAVET